MPRTIVVGYDGSDHATDALELGRMLARLLQAELVVACAYPDDPLGESAAAVEIAQGMRADAERTLARARERMSADGGGDFRAVAGPSPSQVLHELAEQLGAEAIVLGATHHGTALRLLAGSTPEHVLDHAPCPVAVAPEGYAERAVAAGTPQRIAVAYDGSPEAEKALEAAAPLAAAAGARLRLVTAVNVAAVSLYPPLDVTSYEQLTRLARDEAREKLEAAAERLRSRGVAVGGGVEVEVLDGDVVPALVGDSAGEDLLFAGSRAQGAFRRVLLGSISRHLLREAACPVVVVPRGGE